MFVEDIPLIWQPMNNPMDGEEVIHMPVINLNVSYANTLLYLYLPLEHYRRTFYKVKQNKKKTFRSGIVRRRNLESIVNCLYKKGE